LADIAVNDHLLIRHIPIAHLDDNELYQTRWREVPIRVEIFSMRKLAWPIDLSCPSPTAVLMDIARPGKYTLDTPHSSGRLSMRCTT